MQLDIENNNHTAISNLFKKNSLDYPIFKWNPTDEDLYPSELKFLLNYWQNLKIPHKIEPLDMLPVLGYLMILDVINEGEDFYYRLYGSKIADKSGFDLTGKTTSMVPVTITKVRNVCIPEFIVSGYKAVVNKQIPLLTLHTPSIFIDVYNWTRLVLPLLDENNKTYKLLVGNIPGNYKIPEFKKDLTP